MLRQPFCLKFLLCLCGLVLSSSGLAATPTVGEALGLSPVQKNIPLETPEDKDLEKCTIKAEKFNGSTAWVIRGPGGDVLRRFADSDGDNVVDTWSYFHTGLEIYRDIDADHNGKADQYRWFHSAGTRWGIDRDEDGTIDSWKLISPEEVAEEVVEAVRTGDQQRFQRLLLTEKELESLGFAKEQTKQVAARTKAALDAFKQLVSAGSLEKDSEFTDFGGLKPGLVPAGTQGSSKDVIVYESIWAMVRNGKEHQQMQLGTMVNFNNSWKLIGGPVLGNSQDVAASVFFTPGPGGGAGAADAASSGQPPSEKMQQTLAELEKLDQQITAAPQEEKPDLNLRRANMLLELANLMTKRSEREQWLRQLADMVDAAVQDGSFPKGVEYLKRLEEKLAEQVEAEKLSEDLLVYFEFHRMQAEYYGITMADPKVDYAKAQGKWMKDLEAFVEEHPKSEHGAEALRQLAMGSEMIGESETAVKWYRRVLEDYPQSVAAKMAQGAVLRLTSEGQKISLQGTAVDGDEFDLKQHAGKTVVIQYWTTTSEVCIADHAVLKDLYAKYAGRGLEIVGVNLDYTRDQLVAYLKENRLPWKQLYEEGGFDGRLATEMGVVTVPLMVLVGPQGKVVSSNIQAAEIEHELRELLATKEEVARKQ